jgi:MoxR-like ATPase
VTESNPAAAKAAAEAFRAVHLKIKKEVQRVIVGQEKVIDAVLTALMVGGHVMLEGVPGLGKTMLVRALGEAVDINFSRIQFTPDMMPADIQGTSILVEGEDHKHEVRFQEGPLVANLVLADEINRATPKTQSALLEAMQEKQITIGKRTIKLEEPFCVMSTQNPIEQEGTYPLPEAQLDRFLFKIIVGYPAVSDYKPILERTTGNEEIHASHVSTGEEVMRMREVVRGVPVPGHVQDYAVHLVVATQPKSEFATPLVNQNVLLGSSPRGAQGLLLAGKVQALLAGRFAVSTDDIRAVALDVLRHRIIVNFQGQAEGFTPDHIIEDVLAYVNMPANA